MEVLNQKSLEKIVSQKAMQMGNSSHCKICVIGFLCGVCLASLLLTTLTSLATFNPSTFSTSDIVIGTKCDDFNAETNSREKLLPVVVDDDRESESSSLLYSAWTENLKKNVPAGPHLENCRAKSQRNKRLDRRIKIGNGNYSSLFPPWSGWKGNLDTFPGASSSREGSYPPWVVGSDEENYPLTRKVQRDLWLHQHPLNCSDSSVKFLVADWETEPGFGIGAQIAGMAGLFAIAVNEKRVLVTGYYNRADHRGCTGSSRSSWSCYFFSETSRECRDRAFELVASKEAWRNGIVTGKQSYNSKQIWSGRTPRLWGQPWSFLQPTTEINGSLIARHRKMDRRWWRAQAVRYLMRYQTKHTCGLLNSARHSSFGKEAARMVVRSFTGDGESSTGNERATDMEEYVWSSHGAWLPRPLLSVHVRMGDKACEMKVVEFEEYMRIAARIRRRFPHLNSIWLSTEMQEVIDKSKRYSEWRFYYTDVKRQSGNVTMAEYEAGLGRETATENSMVNFLMAIEADFFVGALGSTWCFLIDGMRNTGGKVMAGYLSVNKDRFW